MEKWLADIMPILGIEHNCILSKQGDITIGFKAMLPEIFTLSEEEYENIHQAWVKAIKVLPKHSTLCKQDWFITKRYEADTKADSKKEFLERSADKHFKGRPYLDHSCYIFLTKKPVGRKLSSSMFSNLIRSSIVPEQTLNPAMLSDFEDIAGQFRQILEDTGLMKLSRLTGAELESSAKSSGVIEQYCFLSTSDDPILIKDMEFDKDGMRIGRQHCQLYTLADAVDLPALCGSRINYDKYSTDKTKFSIGFAGSLGLLLHCNHIYTQYIVVDDSAKTLQKLERKRLRLQSLSAYSRENLISRDATNDFLNEAISEQRLPVKGHFNILVWSEDKNELKNIRNQVTTAMSRIDAVAKLETSGAPQLFWAGIPGNASDLPYNECFDTFAEQASCFLNIESNYRSDPKETGIRFCDRLSGKPVYIDLFDLPRKRSITSNMGVLCCGSSGGGKSMTLNHILNTLYINGSHCVIVDIGGSYKGLCELVQGYYFTYTESDPISFNPFYLPKGQDFDTEKKESLKALLVSLWKQENDSFNRSEYVALSNALAGFYTSIKTDHSIFPCFNTFYEYLQTDFKEVLKEHRVKDTHFDVDNFLYVLRPYYRGNEFDYLLNATENLDLLEQPFIVVELDNIKSNPILFPVVTLIIMEMFISKMRKLAGTRKVLAIDEAWAAIAKSGMAEFLKYAFKTIRKFNGVPIVITQELDDLISSPIIKDAIINNADIKIMMDMRKFLHKFDKLQAALGMSEKAKTQLLSVNKDEREIYIELGGQVCRVFKNELCKEEYLAYTTEGKERVRVLQAAAECGSMEAGITRLVAENYLN
ncbi:MAG: TraG family conjugative transposon ATPase [Sphingobacterium sp.]|jgi:conjugation system TraG family ATPase|nr:TraG family conjugative transposon ATPase [Sphingobacterium sp.]